MAPLQRRVDVWNEDEEEEVATVVVGLKRVDLMIMPRWAGEKMGGSAEDG